MAKRDFQEFAVDNASILFLSLIKPCHTNSFRFTVTLREPVCADVLQEAVNRITPRFPSVIAGLRQDFLGFRQVPMAQPPTVQPDSAPLRPMFAKELKQGCFRVFYGENTISLEAFHALTDGYGAITVMTTLLAEYLQLHHGVVTPVGLTRLEVSEAPQPEEVEDAFLRHTDVSPKHLSSRFSYLPHRPEGSDWQVRFSHFDMDVKPLLDTAHRYNTTLNTFLTTVLASSVMDYQLRHRKKLKPVRIMIPVDLRRLAGSRTLRNFTLYALPTMEAEHRNLSFRELCDCFHEQLSWQLSREMLLGMAAHNVRTQNAWYVKWVPWKAKRALLRFGYRFFGESNSSLTLTNLGRVDFPAALKPYIADFQCYLTPRVTSPYGCTAMSYDGKLSLNMSHFSPEDEIGKLFFEKLKEITQESCVFRKST